MKRVLLVCLALGVICSLASPPQIVFAAEDTALEALIFQSIPNVVTPGRREMSIKQSPNAISVISRADIQYSPCRTIPELLQYVVGMDGYTKTHTDQDVVARGQVFDEAGQMLVLIDGQPVNVALYTGMQWPTLPITLDDIERIEVMRGPGSATYGADALLGVINIITLPVAERKSNIKVMIGEKGTQSVEVHGAQPLTPELGLAVTVAYNQTQGRGQAETEAATQLAPNWDIKDWAEISQVGYRMDYADALVKVMSQAAYSADQEGYNPSPGDLDFNFSRKQTAYMSNKVTVPFEVDEISLTAGFRNIWQENLKLSAGNYVFKYVCPKGVGVDANLQYLLRRLEMNTLSVGLNYSQVIASREIANPEPYMYDASDILIGAYLQDQLSLLNDDLQITLGARYDKWTSLDGIFSPMVATNYMLLEKTLTFRVMAGTSFRRPDYDSRFYYVDLSQAIGPDSWFKGTDLTLTTADGRLIEGKTPKPATALTYEGGVRYDPTPNTSANLNFFAQTIKDFSASSTLYANFDPLAGPVGYNLSYRNDTGRIEIQGLELELSHNFNNIFKIWGNWTGQMGKVVDEAGITSTWMAMPKNKINLGILFSGPVNLDLRGRYVGDSYFNDAQGLKVAAYKTLDVSFFKEFGPLMVKLAVLNLLNDVHYEYPLYTQLVRKAMLTAQYTF